MSIATLPAGLTAGNYAIDPAHSEVGFTVRHAMVSKVRGSFTDVEGTVVVDSDANLIKVDATIKIGSITTRNEQRDGHLQSPDFFDVATYPTATYRSTGVTVSGEGFVVDGELTIRDVTKPVQLQVTAEGVATDPFGLSRAGFSAELEISRADYGLTWNAVLETGGVMLSDTVKLTLDIEAVKQA